MHAYIMAKKRGICVAPTMAKTLNNIHSNIIWPGNVEPGPSGVRGVLCGEPGLVLDDVT